MTNLLKRAFLFALPAAFLALQTLIPVHAEALSAKDEKAAWLESSEANAPFSGAACARIDWL